MASMKRSEREKGQHIQVFVRCRPASHMEKDSGSAVVVEVKPENREVCVKEKMGLKEQQKKFTFDKVFAPNSTQVDVYRAVAGPMIEEVLMGYNCTVFAYGQTGTGKTYTMQGSRSGDLYTWDTDPQSGIIPRVFHHLFDVLGQQDIEYNVKVSYLELYNEELFDLLGPLQETVRLRLYEDSTKKGSVVIQGLTEVIVHNKDEVYHILERGAERKRMAATLMNDTSSRSHTVFSITVHIKESTVEGEDLVKIGKLNLVDLAGSECIGRSGAVDKRAREAGNINQSLLTLGRVITALVEKAPHIPYRESKLTRLLQDSLGGRTKTSIIATISPAQINIEETNSTLEYAYRAKNITNKPEVNQKMTKRALIKEYTEEMERLRRDLVASQEKNGIYIDVDNYNDMRTKLSQQSEAIQGKLAEIEALQEQKQKISKLFQKTSVQLDQRTSQLETTKQTLDKTAKQLKEKDKDLKATEYQREAQRHLVTVQAKTEKTLKSQAETLLQVASHTTKDLEGLFSKLDRKSRVETTNQKVIKDFRNSLHGQIGGLEDNLCGMFNSYRQQLTSLQEQLEMNMREVASHAERQSQFVEHLASTSDGHSSSTQQALVDVQKVSGKRMEDMLALKSRAMDSTLPKMAVLEENNIALHDAVRLLCESQMEQMQKLSANLASGFQELLSDFHGVGHVLDKELEKMGEFITQREAFLKESGQRKKDSFEAIMTALTQYKLDEEQEYEKEEEKLGEMTSSLASSLCDLKSKSSTIYEKCVVSLDTSSKQQLSETCTELSVNTGAVQELVVKSGDKLRALVGDLKDCHQEDMKMTTAYRQELQTDVHKIVSDLQEHQKSTSTFLLGSSQSIEEHQKQMEVLAKEQTDRVVGLSQWSQEGRSALSSRLVSLQQSATDLVDREIRVDMPTGMTPQRKDYPFPRYLASTGPHQKILEQFRNTMNDSDALSIDIPDSPTKDESTDLPVLGLEISDTVNDDPGNVSEASTSSESHKPPQHINSECKENKPLKKISSKEPRKLRTKTKSLLPKSLLRSPN